MKKKTLILKRSETVDPRTKDAGLREVYALELETMRNSGGWKIVETILAQNKERIGQILITRIDNGKRVDDRELEEFRIQYAQIDQTLELPSRLIAEYRKKPTRAKETFDPYAQSFDAEKERDRISTRSLID